MTYQKKIAVGIDDFESIIKSNNYFVDKTSYIKKFLTGNADGVMLFTRPRRFGKSLTMSMLYNFLAITNLEDPLDISKNKELFAGLEISKDENFCQKYMGKFPTIFISLKNCSGKTFNEALALLVAKVFNVYKFFRVLLEKNLLTKFLTEDFEDYYDTLRAMTKKGDDYSSTDLSILKNSLLNLTQILKAHYGQNVIIIIDEYDEPVAKARHSYYDQILDVIKDLLGNVLKSNNNLSKAFITGCLRITKESVFTGWNNFKVYDISNATYGELFGFNEKEVKELLKYYHFEDKFPMIKEWYDGYRFADRYEMYNPWSVVTYVSDLIQDRLAEPLAYWISTSSNDLINEFIEVGKTEEYDELEDLLQGRVVRKPLNLEMNYRELSNSNINSFWSILYVTGYLTLAEDKDKNEDEREKDSRETRTIGYDSSRLYALRIPNKEVRDCFKRRIVEYFQGGSKKYQAGSVNLIGYMAKNDADNVKKELTNLLENYIGVQDVKKSYEYMYHMFINGVLVASNQIVKQVEDFKSNEASGEGYADIRFVTKNLEGKEVGIVLELKRATTIEEMYDLTEVALKQCKEKEYYREYIKDRDIHNIYIYGISFYKRKCAVKSEEILK